MNLAPEHLADLRKRAEAAEKECPSPWTNRPADDMPGRSLGIEDAQGGTVVKTDSGMYPPEHNTAEFIAAACPAVVLALLNRIDALERGLLEMGAIKLIGAVRQHAARLPGDP